MIGFESVLTPSTAGGLSSTAGTTEAESLKDELFPAATQYSSATADESEEATFKEEIGGWGSRADAMGWIPGETGAEDGTTSNDVDAEDNGAVDGATTEGGRSVDNEADGVGIKTIDAVGEDGATTSADVDAEDGPISADVGAEDGAGLIVSEVVDCDTSEASMLDLADDKRVL